MLFKQMSSLVFRNIIRELSLGGLIMAITGISLAASGQTLTITNGVQKYASLTSMTVNMSGKCELWATNAAPLTGCTINLNSVDAWLFLPNVKPSVVVSSYLSQIFVGGTAAVADNNIRVVQYGQNGAVVIPQPSNLRPLTTYSGAEFSGAPIQFGQWTYYTGTSITNISSFKLKRGYQAVFAQSSDGKNWSKCYVAQDGDLEVGVMPSTLDKQVHFIYVTPWRWTSKKGIAGNPPYSWLNVLWWYDWNLDQSSSRDLEYEAIRQTQYWPSLNQNWQAAGINTVLGYNEPDNTSQANLSVSTAISSWGDLLATGLRIGSPATTDGGRSSWLYPFVSQADAAGLRVDFVAVHYYWGWNPADPSGAANQMYNFLLDIWNNTHRPIWITEWNNGANWTDNNPYPPPTYAQQQACIAVMTQMLENTPFVERYALYNWVEDVRSLVTSSNTITAAGTTYSNLVSNISYAQAVPDNGTRSIAEYLFATNTWDSSGYCNNGMAVGAPAYTTGHSSQVQAIILDGANSYVQLPANIAKGKAFTFAGWVNWNGGPAWQRIFDFGNDTSHYLFLTPDSGSGTLRFAVNNGNGEQIIERAGALALGTWQHVAVTLNGSNAALYVNGIQVASSSTFSNLPSAISPIKNYIGKSQFSADPLFNGSLDGFEFADYAMSAAQIAALYNSASYPVYTGGVWTNNADGNWSSANNWNNSVIPNGPGFIADFNSIDITANRTVTLDSARTTGGLRFGDLSGTQNWFLTGASAMALDGGSNNIPTIAVNQNTATISVPLTGNYGFTKVGTGTLVLNTNCAFGGGLLVNSGSVSVKAGTNTFGAAVSSIGYETGSGTLGMSNTVFTALGNVWVGGSDQNGASYNAMGILNITGGTINFGGPGGYGGAHYADGGLAIAAGNNFQNACSGTVNVSGGIVWCTNDLIVGFAGTGTGFLNISGTAVINVGAGGPRWLSLGKWDTSSGIINISGGNLNLLNNTALKYSSGNGGNNGGGGTNMITQSGGSVCFYSDGGTTAGGSGYLDLSQSGSATANNTYNLNGGILIVPSITSMNNNGIRAFNFNGGTLKATTTSASFLNLGSGNAVANIRNGGAVIDDGGFNITIQQPLLHSIIYGDNPIDGGLSKNGSGTLFLSGTNSYTGNTVVGSGTLELAQNTLWTNSTIAIAAGAKLRLDFSATNRIGQLLLNGIVQAPGIYNSNTASNYIAGIGSLQVPVAINAANIIFSAGTTNLMLLWPLDHTGWRLQAQTNTLDSGLGTNWTDVPSSTQTNNVSVPIDATTGSVFYRLIYP